MNPQFPRLKSLKVVVEERRLEPSASPYGRGNWRTHEYTGIQAVPETLRPAFASPGTAAEVELWSFVQEAYSGGRTEYCFDADYSDGTGCDKVRVSRTITVHLAYRSSAQSEASASQARIQAIAERSAA